MRRRDLVAAAVLQNALLACAQPARVDGLAKLDPLGKVDASPGINEALRRNRDITVPPGRFLIGSEPIRLANGQRLTGSPGTVLVKSGPPSRPLVWIPGGRDVVVSRIQLENSPSDIRSFVLSPGGADRVELDIPMAWRWPGLTVEVRDREGWRALQYLRDFTFYKDMGRHGLDFSRFKRERKGEVPVRCFVQPGWAPLIAVEDGVDVSVLEVSTRNGAIVYHASKAIDARFTVDGCDVQGGQIRVQGDINTMPQFIDQATPRPDGFGARSIRITRNKVQGPFSTSSQRRYIKFTERVHGILVAGAAGDVEILRNEVTGVAGDGLYLQSCIGGKVEGNTFRGNALSGIGLENTKVRRSQGVEITRNTCTGNWFDGCDFNYGDPAHISCEDLRGPVRENGSIRLIANEFSGNGGDMPELSGGCGIYARWVEGAVIDANVCEDNNLSGILCELTKNLQISNNRLSGNGRSARGSAKSRLGIGLFGDSGTVASSNTFIPGPAGQHPMRSAPWKGRCKGSSALIEVGSP